ncbi:hypothetical protein [Luteolibacter sp. AS25]|uniref:hypothetical protein n=1 Tax=Luteolibacter sp. AS25 TaxID=3135776 RepID=UPI00398AB0D9
MNPGWQISKFNFTDDDGSLPSIDLSNLSGDGLRSIATHFFNSGMIATPDATIYDNISERNLSLSEVADPVGLVISGRVSTFHCCFACLSWRNVELPTLGLFVSPDGVDIDYRMGSEWSPDSVDAFFRLISHFISLEPDVVVESGEVPGLPFPGRFDEALDHYAPNRKRRQNKSKMATPRKPSD